MKLLFLLSVIVIFGVGVYAVTSRLINAKKKIKKFNVKALFIAGITVISLLGIVATLLYNDSNVLDSQCSRVHTITSSPPQNPHSVTEYFALGNYDYD